MTPVKEGIANCFRVCCKATKKHGKIHKQKFRSTHQIERNFLIRMCFFLAQSFATLDLLQIDFISSVPIFYFLFVIKSFDHEGWVGKSFLPFPKGWSRVVATQRHLTEGAAGKTTIH